LPFVVRHTEFVEASHLGRDLTDGLVRRSRVVSFAHSASTSPQAIELDHHRR
jgi:hypothetical protein